MRLSFCKVATIMLMVITSILPDPLMLRRHVIRTSTISDEPPRLETLIYLRFYKQWLSNIDNYLGSLFQF